MDHNLGRVGADAGSLTDALRRRRNTLVPAALDDLSATFPTYGALPQEALDGEIRAAADRAFRMLLATLEGREPAAEDVAEVSASGARRAEEGVPLDELIGTYLVSTRTVLADLGRDLGPQAAELVVVLDAWIQTLEIILTQTVHRYVEEQQLRQDVRADAARTLLEALLDGSASADHVADHHLVVQVAVAPHPDECDPDVDRSIARRRKARRLQGALDRGPAGTLADLDAEGGLVLLPLPTPPQLAEPDAAPLPDHRALAAQLAEDLAAAAGAPVTLAFERAAVRQTAEARTVAGEVLTLVLELGRPPGCYELADVLVEYQVRQPGPARRQLAQLLEPLAQHPELAETLRRFLDSGRNRRQTALELGVHPNTVDYRLRRVAERTGLDPADHHDALQLGLALIAQRAEAAGR